MSPTNPESTGDQYDPASPPAPPDRLSELDTALIRLAQTMDVVLHLQHQFFECIQQFIDGKGVHAEVLQASLPWLTAAIEYEKRFRAFAASMDSTVQADDTSSRVMSIRQRRADFFQTKYAADIQVGKAITTCLSCALITQEEREKSQNLFACLEGALGTVAWLVVRFSVDAK